MIKTILVPVSGTDTDNSVFATALALARPLRAHLEFLHLRLTVYEAAARSPHVSFCRGAALTGALDFLSERDDTLTASGNQRFREFCQANGISIHGAPAGAEQISASWAEEADLPERRLSGHARHSDVVVVGRAHDDDLMPNNLIEMLLLDSGCPILIAADSSPTSLEGSIVVGWKEASEAARALAAAIPLLRRARRVILVDIAEGGAKPEPLDAVARRLEWHGIIAETHQICDNPTHADALLPAVAMELHADLLVVGGFGHSPMRESVFGGVTRALIDHAALPVFMMH